ncbi:MAG: 1-acylglycerol-3-phosphate O-acyltransferase [Candidatus Riflebacteria bacterium]|nr:1-acylglycerol-3-phosphate O-acyltransferase [Candidatus Riflebacteria bacterium]
MNEYWTFSLAVLTGISLSACTGFRAFLPPFLLGLALKFGPNWLIPFKYLLSLEILTRDPVLIALGVAVVVEFIGDKVPYIDHLLDLIHAPIKFFISSLLTYSIIPQSGEHAWIYFILAIIIGGGTGLTVHGGKAALRATSTAATGGVMNPALSLMEEIIAVLGTFLSIIIPLLSGLILLFLLIKFFKWVFGKSGGNKGEISKTLPSYFFVRIVKVILKISLGLYNRLTFEGLEKVPQNGAMVVVANHASMIDGFLIGTAIGRPIHIMVKKEAFENPFAGWFLRKCFSFPIDREKPEPTTIKMVFKLLKEGQPLALFPEGTRNPEGKVRSFKPGALKLATKHAVPIVPAFIANSHLLMPTGAIFPRPVTLKLRFGEPIDVSGLQKSGKTEDEIGELVYQAVCEQGAKITGTDVRDSEFSQKFPAT